MINNNKNDENKKNLPNLLKLELSLKFKNSIGGININIINYTFYNRFYERFLFYQPIKSNYKYY
jgi:hypothetical protein